MKLKDVKVCLNCDEIFEFETIEFLDQEVLMDTCPACGSRHSYRLSTWIPTLGTCKEIIHRMAAETQ